MNFIGIDPSLTSTGIAVITSKGTEVASFGSPSPKKGEDTQCPQEQVDGFHSNFSPKRGGCNCH